MPLDYANIYPERSRRRNEIIMENLENRIENREIFKNAPRTEPERQHYFIGQCRKSVKKRSEELGRPLFFRCVTFGCQMNARDSEKLEGILEAVGYRKTDSEEADFVIYNTCTVRENANLKVYGHLGQLGKAKKKQPWMKIALCGCMMQEPQVVEKLKKSL